MIKYIENNKNIFQFNKDGYELVISRLIPDKRNKIDNLRDLGK